MTPLAEQLRRGDAALCLACNRWGRRAVVRRVFVAISRMGDGACWYLLMGLAVLLDGSRGVAASAHMAATGGIALLLYQRLKRHTRRPRPFATDHRIKLLVHPLDEFSFPSGHTLHAMAFSAVACWHYPALVAVLVPFTALVAASRVLLGVHYPSDVLAALLIGAALAAASIALWPLA
jgi:undecaprenyl-diphosphatase